MPYELIITFTQEQVQQLNAQHLQLVVTKGIYQATGGHSIVVWQAFEPAGQNMLHWETDYSIYATSSINAGGVIIRKTATTPADLNQGYVFKDDGTFGPSSTTTPDTYTVVNRYTGSKSMSFGLAQDAYVNGNAITNAPVSMVAVALNFSASFAPIEDVTLYLAGVFDSANNNPIPITNGQILYIPDQQEQDQARATTSTVLSVGTPLLMKADQPVNVAYDSATSRFVVQ